VARGGFDFFQKFEFSLVNPHFVAAKYFGPRGCKVFWDTHVAAKYFGPRASSADAFQDTPFACGDGQNWETILYKGYTMGWRQISHWSTI